MGIHRWPENSPLKGPVTWQMFPFDDVIMKHAYIGMHKLFLFFFITLWESNHRKYRKQRVLGYANVKSSYIYDIIKLKNDHEDWQNHDYPHQFVSIITWLLSDRQQTVLTHLRLGNIALQFPTIPSIAIWSMITDYLRYLFHWSLLLCAWHMISHHWIR